MAVLLLIEDDDVIGASLESILTTSHHRVAWARNGRDGLALADQVHFDLVLLDLGLPDLDGFDVCRQIRTTQPHCVLIILTASDVESDVVVGLEAGADDYLTKPFRSAELLARLRAHLRRGVAASSAPRSQQLGNLHIDKARRSVSLSGHDLGLRAKEFDLLSRLALEHGQAVSRAALIVDVWGASWTGSHKTLDVHLSNLRRRLADTAAINAVAAPRIVTIRGAGFRLELPAEISLAQA